MDMYADVLIVGSGVAGLYSALNLRKDLKILVISKEKIDECNTSLAQGGISVAKNTGDIPMFVADTLKAGSYKNDLNAVTTLCSESIENIENLKKFGFNFDQNENGLNYTREGAHSINRIVHYKDKTGKKLEETLIKEVYKNKNINILENCYLVDLITENNLCLGGICLKNDFQVNIYSKIIILATGGIGGVFNNSTNKKIITGDGIALALKNNIKVKNLDYIQFHPTALFKENSIGRKFLISESLRGEGAKLINCNGERFVNELLPRDVVTKKIYDEKIKTHSNHVYLDVTFMASDYLKTRFPNIYVNCLENGIDICKDLIPVSPAQHYFMGGIDVDTFGKTSMENLYAFGEVSCTGVHGKNRLASNSLLEGLVFPKRGASKINKIIDTINYKKINAKKLSYNLNYYNNLNKNILINSLIKLRGDLKNELVIS